MTTSNCNEETKTSEDNNSRSSKNYLIYLICGFAAVGGFLFGYDTGVISGILVIDSFNKYFNINGSSLIEGTVASILVLGCFVGSLSSGYICDRFGRKNSIFIASLIFIVGAILQTAAQNIGYIYAGRLIAGLGIGQLSMCVPLYQSEVATVKIRGRLVSLQQFAITIGIAASFWIDYAAHRLKNNVQWRLPFGLQIVPAFLLAVGALFFPYSPRWLANKNRLEDSRKALAKLRSANINDPYVTNEFEEMVHGINTERETAVKSYFELLKKGIRKRIILGILIQVFQQLTGINAIMYYAPALFAKLGNGTDASLLAQGINGLVNIVFTIPAILFIDKWGRKPTLIVGAILMTISMTIVGALLGTYGIVSEDSSVQVESKAVGYVMILFIYIFVASFAFSWGPIGWIYPSEIFPSKIRSKAMSITTASNWLFNYIVTLVTPKLLEKISFGVFIIFASFGLIMTVTVALFFPETKGRSLEEMDSIFGDNDKERPEIKA